MIADKIEIKVNNKLSFTGLKKSIIKNFNRKIKDYSIKKKISFGFGLIMIVNIIFITSLLFNMGIMSQKISRLYNGPFSTNDMVWDTRVSLVKIDRYMYRAMLESDGERINKFLNLADEEENILKQLLSRQIFLH